MAWTIKLVSGLAVLLWPAVIAGNLRLKDSDAAGNGLARVYTVAGTTALWGMLV